MSRTLTITLADQRGLVWAQEQVTRYHYLHRPVDARCSPVAYLVLDEDGQRLGCLIFGRPQAQRVSGWYGSVADVEAGRCGLSRWQIINLLRVWLSPLIQCGGTRYVPNAGTQVIAAALSRIGYDFLLVRPVCFLLTHAERRAIEKRAQESLRSRRCRAMRTPSGYEQGVLVPVDQEDKQRERISR